MHDPLDLRGFLKIVKRRLSTIIITTLCVFAFTALATQYVVKPTFEATEYILVGKLKKDDSYYGEIRDINMLLASTIDYMKSPIILNEVTKEFSVQQDVLSEMIAVKNNRDSQIINIVVRAKSAELAKQIAHLVGATTVEKMNSSLKVDEIQVLSSSENDIAIEQIGSAKLNMAIGFAVGLFVGIALAMLREYFSDALTDIKEVEVHLGFEVLGEIDLKTKMHTFKMNRKRPDKKEIGTMQSNEGGEIIA